MADYVARGGLCGTMSLVVLCEDPWDIEVAMEFVRTISKEDDTNTLDLPELFTQYLERCEGVAHLSLTLGYGETLVLMANWLVRPPGPPECYQLMIVPINMIIPPPCPPSGVAHTVLMRNWNPGTLPGVGKIRSDMESHVAIGKIGGPVPGYTYSWVTPDMRVVAVMGREGQIITPGFRRGANN